MVRKPQCEDGGTARLSIVQREESLIHDVRRDSQVALGRLLENCQQYLLIVAQGELGDELQAKAGASDLVQESLLEAQQAFGRFQGTTREEFLAWTRKILLHNVANLRRKYRQAEKRQVGREVPLVDGASSESVEALLAAADTSPSGRAIRQENVELVHRAMERLPEHYRLVLELRHGQQRTFEQIGQALGRSADAARMLWWRAFEQLGDQLEGFDDAG